jgi:hypothetical protein
MRQLFNFIIITTIIGIVLWPCVFVLLQLSNILTLLVDTALYRIINHHVDRPPERFRLLFFAQTVFICGIYSAVFPTVVSSFVTNRHVTATWFYALLGLLLMLFFIGLIIMSARDRRKDTEWGAVVGLWLALIGYAFFYRYPRILGSIPGAITVYNKLVSLTEWLLSFWLLRGILGLLAGGVLFSMAWLTFYWLPHGFSRLAGTSQRHRTTPPATVEGVQRRLETYPESVELEPTVHETSDGLINYCRENGRVCPLPQKWSELYERLPNKTRVGMASEPALPLILAAWHDTPVQAKMQRLADHIRWADKHGRLPQIGTYLRNLREEDWYHLKDYRDIEPEDIPF